jgi:hypothetical protein
MFLEIISGGEPMVLMDSRRYNYGIRYVIGGA